MAVCAKSLHDNTHIHITHNHKEAHYGKYIQTIKFAGRQITTFFVIIIGLVVCCVDSDVIVCCMLFRSGRITRPVRAHWPHINTFMCACVCAGEMGRGIRHSLAAPMGKIFI